MTTVNAYAVMEQGGKLEPFSYELGELGPDEVDVKVTHCGLCHSDITMIDNDLGMSAYPLVPGHEAVGIVERTGAHVSWLKEGDRVGVGWQSGSCGHCEWCKTADENFCGEMEGTIVGRQGGYADRVRVNHKFAIPIPDGYDSAAAGPMMCGGITVYNPFVDYGVRSGMKVGVIGIGGLGHLALQFARAMGCEVTAFSRSRAKEEEARGFGAHHYVATGEEGVLDDTARTQDFIINTVSANIDWNAYLPMLRPRGSFVQVGLPDDPNVTLNAIPLLFQQARFGGNPIGSPARMRDMMDFANTFDIKPMIEHFKLSDCNAAIERARAYKQRYRIVMEV